MAGTHPAKPPRKASGPKMKTTAIMKTPSAGMKKMAGIRKPKKKS